MSPKPHVYFQFVKSGANVGSTVRVRWVVRGDRVEDQDYPWRNDNSARALLTIDITRHNHRDAYTPYFKDTFFVSTEMDNIYLSGHNDLRKVEAACRIARRVDLPAHRSGPAHPADGDPSAGQVLVDLLTAIGVGGFLRVDPTRTTDPGWLSKTCLVEMTPADAVSAVNRWIAAEEIP